MRQQEKVFEDLGVRIKVVTFDANYMALAYVKDTRLKWPLLIDPDLELYGAYGMARGSWWDIYNPISIWSYLKLIFSGKGPGKPGRDWRQLGGDILIDSNGIVCLHHVSKDPHDRPSIESIVDLIDPTIANPS